MERAAWRLCLIAALCSGLAALSAGAEIRGKVGYSVDGINIVPPKPGTATELLLTDAAGALARRTFADRDGWFMLLDVAPGSYVLTTHNPGFIYPEVLLEVTGNLGLARAAYLFNKQQIPTTPLIVRPAAVAQYYELRKPLDVWGFVKSPYGMMIGFMLVGIVIFPMLKVDPEEYKQAMAELRGEVATVTGGGQQQQQRRIRDR